MSQKGAFKVTKAAQRYPLRRSSRKASNSSLSLNTTEEGRLPGARGGRIPSPPQPAVKQRNSNDELYEY